MKSKKGQGELITTVLIILVVLAAVAIVATFIIRNVKTSTETAENRTAEQIAGITGAADCGMINLDIASASSDEVNVTQASGTKTADDVRIIINGVVCNTTAQAIAPGETQTYDISDCDASANSAVTVSAVIGTTVCEATGEGTIA